MFHPEIYNLYGWLAFETRERHRETDRQTDRQRKRETAAWNPIQKQQQQQKRKKTKQNKTQQHRQALAVQWFLTPVTLCWQVIWVNPRKFRGFWPLLRCVGRWSGWTHGSSVVFDPCYAVLAGDLGEPTEDPHQPHGPTNDRRPPDQRGTSLHQGVEPPHSRSALQRQRHLRVPHQHQAQADQEGHLVRPRCG